MERDHQLDMQKLQDVELTPAQEPEQVHGRFVGGQVPEVKDAVEPAANNTASQLAYEVAEAGEDKNEAELKRKVGALCEKKFGGDYAKAFAHYDGDHDGMIDGDELGQLLKEAGIGNMITRGAWVKGILDKLDSSGDRKIGWAEFQAVFEAPTKTAMA